MTMTPDEYKRAALRTENTPLFIDHARRQVPADASITQLTNAERHDIRLSRIMHAILGMITELGELCDPVKRHLIYGVELDTGNMVEEMGDREWYSSGLMLDALEARLEDIWERNINKLRSRFPHKFTEEAAVKRDLDAEKRALERETDTMGGLPGSGAKTLAEAQAALGMHPDADLVQLISQHADGTGSWQRRLLHVARLEIERLRELFIGPVGATNEALEDIRRKLDAEFAPMREKSRPAAIYAAVVHVVNEYNRLSREREQIGDINELVKLLPPDGSKLTITQRAIAALNDASHSAKARLDALNRLRERIKEFSAANGA